MAYLTRSNLTTLRLPDGWGALIVDDDSASGTQDECSTNPKSHDDWVPLLCALTKDRSALAGYSVLKYGADGEVGRTRAGSDAGSTEVICKQSKARGIVKILATIFVGSRARRNCERAHTLLDANIRTARPMALMQSRWPHRETWLITEFVSDLVDLDHVTSSLIPRLDVAERNRVKRGIIAALVEMLRRLRQSGLVHRDLKASNIMLRHWNGEGKPVEVYLVDLDGLHRAGMCRGANGDRALVRLAASLQHHAAITRTDRVRFLRAWMTATNLPAEAWKLLYRQLAQRAVRYARHSRRRKTHKLDGYTGE